MFKDYANSGNKEGGFKKGEKFGLGETGSPQKRLSNITRSVSIRGLFGRSSPNRLDGQNIASGEALPNLTVEFGPIQVSNLLGDKRGFVPEYVIQRFNKDNIHPEVMQQPTAIENTTDAGNEDGTNHDDVSHTVSDKTPQPVTESGSGAIPPIDGRSALNDSDPDPNEPEIQIVLMTAIAKQNEVNEQIGIGLRISVSERTKFGLKFIDPAINNELCVAAIEDTPLGISTYYAPIGHFDPSIEGFFYYPEVISEEGARMIDPLARKAREETLGNYFNHNYDYDDPVIRDLWRKHRKVFLQDRLIYKIAERYGALPSTMKSVFADEILIDDSTSFIASVTPGNYEDDAFITISLYGDSFRENGIITRRPSVPIYIGRRDLDTVEAKFLPDSRLVTDAEFGKILDLTTELQQLKATQYPNLDTAIVALKRE